MNKQSKRERKAAMKVLEKSLLSIPTMKPAPTQLVADLFALIRFIRGKSHTLRPDVAAEVLQRIPKKKKKTITHDDDAVIVVPGVTDPIVTDHEGDRCKCGHKRKKHYGMTGLCRSRKCSCTKFRLNTRVKS